MRKTEQIMGMPISVDIPGCQNQKVFDGVFNRFREIDGRFSTYKKDSEVSRYSSGKLNENELSDELKIVIKACRLAEKLTNGYFSAWASGDFDPSGYVKGWAIDEAAKIIRNSGYGTFCIGAGGDVLAASDSEKQWQIAVQNPEDIEKILNTLSIKNGAVATSGNYQRGEHIYNPKNRQPAKDLLSITISGPDIIMADVFATAGFAMGAESANFIARQTGYEAIIIPNRRSPGNNR